jgi:uncharacterized protein YecE (DUF72 family)
MEFRHPSWYVAETFQLLEQKAIALCLHDKDGSSISEPFVGPSAYVRFHGTSGRYHGSYSSQRLDHWAHRLVEQWQTGRPVYAYFNNDPDAVATENARTLKTQIDAAAAASSAQGGSPTAPTAEQAPPLRSQFVH